MTASIAKSILPYPKLHMLEKKSIIKTGMANRQIILSASARFIQLFISMPENKGIWSIKIGAVMVAASGRQLFFLLFFRV